jgi:hypothetical protein
VIDITGKNASQIETAIDDAPEGARLFIIGTTTVNGKLTLQTAGEIKWAATFNGTELEVLGENYETDGLYIEAGGSITLTGNLSADIWIDALKGGALNVNGNVSFEGVRGELWIDGGTVTVKGNVGTSFEDYFGVYISGGGILKVGGTLIADDEFYITFSGDGRSKDDFTSKNVNGYEFAYISEYGEAYIGALSDDNGDDTMLILIVAAAILIAAIAVGYVFFIRPKA